VPCCAVFRHANTRKCCRRWRKQRACRAAASAARRWKAASNSSASYASGAGIKPICWCSISTASALDRIMSSVRWAWIAREPSHVLGIELGATENAAAVKQLLTNLRDQGLPTDRKYQAVRVEEQPNRIHFPIDFALSSSGLRVVRTGFQYDCRGQLPDLSYCPRISERRPRRNCPGCRELNSP